MHSGLHFVAAIQIKQATRLERVITQGTKLISTGGLLVVPATAAAQQQPQPPRDTSVVSLMSTISGIASELLTWPVLPLE